MRVAFDIRLLYILRARGIGSAIMSTLLGFYEDPRGNEYLLLVDRYNYENETDRLIEEYFPELQKVLDDPRFEVRVVPEYHSDYGSFQHTLEQLRCWRSLRLPPEIVFYGFLYRPLFCSFPCVVHVPDTFVKVLPHLHTREQKRIIAWQEVCLKRAHLLTTISETSRQDIHRFYGVPLERIFVVHDAIKPCFGPLSWEQRQRLRQKLALPERFLLSVGVIEPRKNLLRLVQALDQVQKETGDRISLLIVGEFGRDFPEANSEVTAEMLRLGIADSVHIVGFVGIDVLNGLYNCAELLVFPSLYEGFGLPPIEAMRCGTPTVVSNTSALPEITSGAAEYVEPQNVQSIASGIVRVLGDREHRERLSRKGLAVAGRYTLAHRTRACLDVLEKALH